MKERFTRTSLCLAIGALLTSFGPTQAYGQTKTTYKEKDLGILPVQQEQPDLTGLWYHINERQIKLANEEFTRLKARYPQWKVPEEVEAELNRINGRVKGTIKTVVSVPRVDKSGKPEADSRPNDSLETSQKQVAKPASEALPLERFAQLTPKARATTPKQKIERLIALSNQLKRTDFYLLMGWTAIDKGMLEVANQQFTAALQLADQDIDKQSAQQGLNSVRGIKLQQALSLRDTTSLAQLFKSDTSGYTKEVLQGAAWQQYDLKNYDFAEALFSLVEDNEGRYLALSAQSSDLAKQNAFDLACSIDTEVFIKRCADGLASRQAQFYDTRRYKESIQAGEALERLRPLSIEERALIGWAAKEIQDISTATSAFEQVLSKTPTNTVIANELVSLNQSNDATLNRLALKYGAVKSILQARNTRNAWPRKQFWLAYQNDDSQAATAQTKDGLSAVYGMNTRSRSGGEGLGNFDVLSQYIGIGSGYKNWLWQVSLDYKQFYSGSPQVGDWFGDRQLDTESLGISGFEDTGVRAEAYYQAPDFNFYANLEYGMFDQPVGAKVTGQISAAKFLSRTTVAATLFRKEKEDSLLSQTGTLYANRDQTWGYVIESGVRGLVAHSIADNMSVAGTAQISRLEGELVADNSALSLRGDVSYDIADKVSSRLDYWRLGPFLSYTSYDKNLSGFTVGNGGYFSPSQFVSIGGYSELLTLEALNWQVKLRSSLALSRVKQDDDLRFPIGQEYSSVEEGVSLGESTDTGLSGNFMAEGQYRIDHNWIVAGYIGKAFAVEYQAFEAGIQIRWREGKGTGVTSDELLLSSPRLSGFAL
ncbi:cellulose synthase subunit BcsC-related outer membrane protein [Alteromonas sp. PRIM-21]|uniref:cellulose synthase subunit BcsC-related outer membrane protein n=1 Tax=Alteromonas sp. PRIM-21 TaxID=1454978 RepID=UPI0022B95B75|nr:cellulose synthase subunit BcsC-related outer membrane protein [Alteromonas sp. PRIM-21]MCZ8530872.1 BCSC C-terminal domain-containing protein [Alteromonas sp. PRIM-21]